MKSVILDDLKDADWLRAFAHAEFLSRKKHPHAFSSAVKNDVIKNWTRWRTRHVLRWHKGDKYRGAESDTRWDKTWGHIRVSPK